MKTKLKHISRRTISLILCVLMLFSTLMVGSISTANAALTASTTPVEDGCNRIFITNNQKFTYLKMYFWGSKTKTNPDWNSAYVITGNSIGTNSNGQTVYYYDLPTDVEGFIIQTSNKNTQDLPKNDGGTAFTVSNGLGLYFDSTKGNKWYMGTWDASDYLPSGSSGGGTTEKNYYYSSNYDGSNHFKKMSVDEKNPDSYIIYVSTADANKSDTTKGYLTGERKFKIADVNNDSNDNLNNGTHCVNHNIYNNFSSHIQKSSSLDNSIDFYMDSTWKDLYIRTKGTTNATSLTEFYIQYTPSEDSNGLNGTIKIWSKADYENQSASTTYPVNFGSNGNGTVSAQVDSNTIENGSQVDEGTEVTFTATADTGYEFEGWYSDSDCTTPISGASGTTYTTSVNSETNVYAKFKETLHTVSIAGGTATSTQAGIATKGTATVNTPTDKTFTGWTIPEGITLTDGTTADDETIKFTATSDNLTVTANFEDIYTVTVTTSTGVASFTPETIAPQKKDAVVTITPSYSVGYEYAAPTVENGTFVQDGNNINVKVSGTGPVTIQLNASPKTFNVTFNSDGGSTCSPVEATYNSKYPTLPTPTKDGYTFNGWYNGETQIKKDDTVSITSDTELQAHWTIKTPTITGAPTQITAKTGEQFTVTGVMTDSFADLSYSFNGATNTTGTFTAPATSGNYTLTITATHKNDNTVKATSTVNVNVSDAFTTKFENVTYYVDMHTNTGTPSIVVDGEETLLTKQGNSTVYSATVSTPYTLNNETAQPTKVGNIGMKVGGAVYPVNGLGVDCITTREVWLEANGKLSTTTVQVKKTEANGAVGGKRVYFTNNINWDKVYLYAFSYENNQAYVKEAWPGEPMISTGWQDNVTGPYIYYFDVPATFNKIVISNGKADGDANKRQTVDISIANATTTTNNHFYIDGGQISDGDDKGKYNVGTVDAIAPKISKYYSEVVLSTDDTNIDLMPSVFSAAILSDDNNRKNINFEVTSGSDVISVDPKTGVITPLKAGPAVVTITAYGTYSVNRSNSDIVTTNVIVGENTVVGGFDVMSYNSVQSTFTAEYGSISSVSTSLVGSKFSSLPISDAGIVTKKGDIYTVLYAAANSTTGYGSLKLNVTAVSQPSADTYEFEKWTKGDAIITGSATATFPVDGGAYKAVYVQVARTTITITYKYKVYDTSDDVYYYDSNKPTIEGTQTYTTSVIGTPTEAEIKEIAAANVPNNLDNDYFDYSFNSSNVVVDVANATATVTLTATAHEYSVYIMSSKKTIQYKRTYQHFIDASSTDFGFAEGTDVIWYQSNKNGDLVSVLSTGTNYRFRAVADNQYIYVVENKDQVSMNGSSVVVSTGNKITTVNNIDKLNQDFYIADYFNGYAMGHDDVQFLGAGVMYYSVNADTGAPSNTTLANSGLVNSTGVGYTTAMEQFLVNRLGTFDTSVNVTTDSATKLGYRYLTAADGAKIFRYSDALEAYQYIFTLTFTNSAANVSKNVRLYSYFVYSYTDGSGGTQYVVSISDGYAQAQMYVSK